MTDASPLPERRPRRRPKTTHSPKVWTDEPRARHLFLVPSTVTSDEEPEAEADAGQPVARPTAERTDAAGEGAGVPADEAELIARVQRGDREAFGVLVRRYSQRAYAVAYRVLQHREDAQDLVQEAFMAALDGIGSFDVTRPFGPWLLRIVTYRGLNARQSRGVRERHVRAAPVEERDGSAEDIGGAPERSEIRARFAAALRELPEKQRLVVQLADVDGFSSQEIGTMLGMPSGTVRWHLHTARAALRIALAPFRRTTDD